jgi:chromosome segregation ATPase
MVRLRRSDSSQQPTQESAARTEDDGRLQELQAKFDTASSSFTIERDQLEKTIGRLELQLGGAASAQAKLQEEIASLKAQWQVERASHQTKIQQMERTVAEISQTREQASSETVNQLRKQSEQKIEEMTQQKMDLSQELHAASERLDAERARFKAEIEELKKNAEARPVAAADNPPDPSIASEVARIENVIHAITAVIDNPDTELSMVIRKNVEKAELDAYLKGILFSLGQGKAI